MRPADQVVLLVGMSDYDRALQKALQSGDTDLGRLTFTFMDLTCSVHGVAAFKVIADGNLLQDAECTSGGRKLLCTVCPTATATNVE